MGSFGMPKMNIAVNVNNVIERATKFDVRKRGLTQEMCIFFQPFSTRFDNIKDRNVINCPFRRICFQNDFLLVIQRLVLVQKIFFGQACSYQRSPFYCIVHIYSGVRTEAPVSTHFVYIIVKYLPIFILFTSDQSIRKFETNCVNIPLKKYYKKDFNRVDRGKLRLGKYERQSANVPSAQGSLSMSIKMSSETGYCSIETLLEIGQSSIGTALEIWWYYILKGRKRLFYSRGGTQL